MSRPCPEPRCNRMLTDDDTRLACPEHYYRISLFTRDRIAEAERTGNGNAYLLAVAQAMRELDEPARVAS